MLPIQVGNWKPMCLSYWKIKHVNTECVVRRGHGGQDPTDALCLCVSNNSYLKGYSSLKHLSPIDRFGGGPGMILNGGQHGVGLTAAPWQRRKPRSKFWRSVGVWPLGPQWDRLWVLQPGIPLEGHSSCPFHSLVTVVVKWTSCTYIWSHRFSYRKVKNYSQEFFSSTLKGTFQKKTSNAV